MDTHIKYPLQKFLDSKRKEFDFQQEVRQTINELLTKKVKKHIQFKGVLDNKIILTSTASSFTYDFKLKKNEILKEIKKQFPQIIDIKIKNE